VVISYNTVYHLHQTDKTDIGLNVQGYICRNIRTFTDARRSDLDNERLPDFETARPTIFPVPIIRFTSRKDSDNMDMNI